MRRYALAAGVVVALGLVGWAVWSTGGDAEPRVRRAARDDANPRPRERKGEPKNVRRSPPPRIDPAQPAPVAAPTKTADQARAELRQLMEELEGIAGRGETLPQEAWVERYKRGTEALQALAMALDSTDPSSQEELGRSNDEFRKLLARVQGR